MSTDWNWTGSSVLITGGTGSFGKKLIEILLNEYAPERVIIFSRDELKQHEMRNIFSEDKFPQLRYFIGDVRDERRLRRAFEGVDLVVHAAALKQVPTAEYNPMEAVLTNIEGTRNVIDAALDTGVAKVMALSTDKAVNPVNLYGATKLVAEKLVVQSNSYSGRRHTRLSAVRYGNVLGSRGSVIPEFRRQSESGTIKITDGRMTRFWITLEQGVRFVIGCIENSVGGEVFVPKIPTMKITELAATIAPNCSIEYTGIRPGEKLHETLISEDESPNTYEFENHYVVAPVFHSWSTVDSIGGKKVADRFSYTSEDTSDHLTGERLLEMIEGS